MLNRRMMAGVVVVSVMASVSYGDALGRSAVRPVQGRALTTLESLQKAVKDDQSILRFAGNGENILAVSSRRMAAERALAADQNALQSYQASARSYETAKLEQAVRNDQIALRFVAAGDKAINVQHRRAAAEARLASDLQALQAIRMASSNEPNRG